MLHPAPNPDPRTDAATAFVRRHQRGVWRFLRAIGCPAHAADEVAQDALLLALDRAIADDQAAAFLRQTAKYYWLRRQRDAGRATARLLDLGERLWQRHCAPDDGDDQLTALRRCIEHLPPRSRLAIERTYGFDLGRRELAAELGISEHGVRTLLQRVRAALRKCIERSRTR